MPSRSRELFADDSKLFPGYERFFPVIALGSSLEKVVIFENFNEQFPFVRHGTENGDAVRRASPAVSQSIARASVNLRHLAASYIADAADFFRDAPESGWPNLITLTLTAKTLDPESDPASMVTLLRDAAVAAARMPRLETMEIWKGKKGLAALFKIEISRRAYQSTITWRGTWKWTVTNSIIKAWELVLLQDETWRLGVVEELLDKEFVKSHADAIEQLKLLDVIRPVSLHQIKLEQMALMEPPIGSDDGN